MKLDLERLRGGESLTSRLSFRAKLLLVLFVPFLALVVVAAAGLSDRFGALHAQQQYGDLSGPLHSLDVASRALQNESVVSSWYVGSNGAPAAELQKARARTNAAVADFRANEQAFADAGLSMTALAALDATNQGFDAIKGERAKIDARTSSANEARTFFLGVDEHLLDFGERAGRDLASSDVAGAMTRVFALERAQHELAREASIQIAVIATGAPQAFSEWVGAQVAQAQHLATFTNTATADELAAYDAVVGQPKPAAELPTAFPPAGQTPGEYYVDYQRRSDTLDRAIDAVDQVVNHAANADAAAALREVRIYGGAAVFAMLLTLLLIWFVSRAVVGPIRRLTAAAREMSQRQLPALVESMRTGADVSAIQPVHIDVQSEDEIGELAQAFNDVEAVTFEVAQEQSRLLRKGMGDLFVNLARRNQSLVQRQLELLDDLERNEHDPAALDALFKLDHMATRMRRNAESLLVLSGAEQPRQWQQPIPLIDVVRAAAAEIADFPRVELVGIDDQLAVSGRAVSDVAHLLAELLENATSFSPPESAVMVSGAVSATGFVLAVSDQGIGMPPERIAEANRLLAEPPAVGLALSRALGLHVVGSLASRHGISVELRPGTPSGLVALIALPTTVLEPRAQAAPPARPVPATPVPPAPAVPTPPAQSLPVQRAAAPAPAPAPAPAMPTTPAAPTSPPAPPAPPVVTTPPAPAPTLRPPDEPPVEIWRAESFAGTSTPPVDERPVDLGGLAFDTATPIVDVPAAEPFFAEPPVVEPPRYEAPPAYDTPAHETPVFDTPVFEAPVFEAPAAPTHDVPPYEAPAAGPGADGFPTAEGPHDEPAPLPTRVPGQHLSHQPVTGGDIAEASADPMRPYRVHELLTRHEQGKRRGQVGDAPDGGPSDARPGSPVPGAPGHVQEDGR